MNNVQSPDSSDSGIEREIVAKGKTAPRITPADIEDNIVIAHFFTAEDGRVGALHAQAPDGMSLYVAEIVGSPLALLTFCVLVLKNGFTVTGESACASPENFDAEIGKKIARANAVQKVWPLMGYQLKERMYQMTRAAPAFE